MDEEKFQVRDESGDKKYFTMIPNYILNHSTAYEQSVYLQMKRIAGDDGRCFIKPSNLAKKMRIRPQKLREVQRSLVERGWLQVIGTAGKTRPYKIYKIVNLWKKNLEFYEKKSANGNLSSTAQLEELNEKEKSNWELNKSPMGTYLGPNGNLSFEKNSPPDLPKEPSYPQPKKNLYKKNQKKKNISSSLAKEVFTYWQAKLNHPHSKFSRDRRQKIEARLREGFSVSDLKLAVDGCAVSPFHCGENEDGRVYDAVNLIFRNAEKVESFMRLTEGKKVIVHDFRP